MVLPLRDSIVNLICVLCHIILPSVSQELLQLLQDQNSRCMKFLPILYDWHTLHVQSKPLCNNRLHFRSLLRLVTLKQCAYLAPSSRAQQRGRGQCGEDGGRIANTDSEAHGNAWSKGWAGTDLESGGVCCYALLWCQSSPFDLYTLW